MDGAIDFLKNYNTQYQAYTKEEEWDLHREMVKGSKEARNKLIESCIPFTIVRSRAYAQFKYGTEVSGDKLDNMIRAGLYGLVQAIDKFDPNRGRLTTIVAWYVRKECRYEAHEDIAIRIPRPALWGKHANKGYRKPIHSLDMQIDSGLYEPEQPSIDVLTKLIDQEEKELLQEVWRELPAREYYILKWRMQGITLAKIGGGLGITRERVRQLSNQAKLKLKFILTQKENDHD